MLKPEADGKTAMPAPKGWAGKPIRVLEFDAWGGVLALDTTATAMGMFDKKDIIKSFECGHMDGIITPPKMNTLQQMAYMARVLSRKGGYDPILKHLVIGSSLHSNKFNDHILWYNQ